VLLVPDYDAADAAPSSEQIASNNEDMREDAPWKDICCILKPNAMHSLGPHKFVRSGGLAANLDVKTYDVGNLFICTVDAVGNGTNWGKVWIEYDVTFFVPQLNPNGPNQPSAIVTGGGAKTAANIFGVTPTSAFSGPSIFSGPTVAGQFTFLQDYSGLIVVNIIGTVITGITFGGGGSPPNLSAGVFVVNGAATAAILEFNIQALSGDTMTLSATATTVTTAIMRAGGYLFSLG